MKLSLSILLASAIALITMSCSDDGNGTSVDAYDRQAMLRGVADKLVIPSMNVVDAEALRVSRLSSDLIANTSPSRATIDTLRSAVLALTNHWQSIVTYDFGPAEGALGSMVENIATFPANAEAIEAFIISGDTSFQNFQRDTRGLAALDYLLNSGTPEEIVARFSGEANVNRRVYTSAVANAIYREIHVVATSWTGPYRQQFIERSGTDAGSSVSLLFNYMNIGYELLKNYKVALPLGKRAGQAAAEPTKVECFYAGASLPLARAQFDAAVDLWYGRTPEGDTFPSFRSYLKTVPNGERLIADTEAQITAVENAFNALGTNTPLSTLVSTNPASVEPLYTELQKLTRFWKSEMSSLLGISITYSSGDGD
ncbi:MAG TPA: imelysin family protein [Candidatus Didemnitutus sp.]|nr:imelysin family protein [Candidatus Didemnitutus sp.]